MRKNAAWSSCCKGVSFLGSSGRVFLLEPPTTTTKKGDETHEKAMGKGNK